MRNDQDQLEKEKVMAQLDLVAALDGDGKVSITGDKSTKHLPKGSGNHVFTFSLTDNSGLHVKFLAQPNFLWVGETEQVPPPPGINSDQVPVDKVKRQSDTMAKFTDVNDRSCMLSYALLFSCDDANQQPMFDPIIVNG